MKYQYQYYTCSIGIGLELSVPPTFGKRIDDVFEGNGIITDNLIRLIAENKPDETHTLSIQESDEMPIIAGHDLFDSTIPVYAVELFFCAVDNVDAVPCFGECIPCTLNSGTVCGGLRYCVSFACLADKYSLHEFHTVSTLENPTVQPYIYYRSVCQMTKTPPTKPTTYVVGRWIIYRSRMYPKSFPYDCPCRYRQSL